MRTAKTDQSGQKPYPILLFVVHKYSIVVNLIIIECMWNLIYMYKQVMCKGPDGVYRLAIFRAKFYIWLAIFSPPKYF